MKPTLTKASCATAALVVLVTAAWAGADATNQPDSAGDRIPMIQMANVPLKDAIMNLARQVDVNYILDPRITGPDGSIRSEPFLTVRWENMTAREALQRVLTDHKLTMVPNPATSVARIAPTNVVAKPVPASVVGADTNPPIPLVVMDSVPLAEAIKNIARQTGLQLTFDPGTKIVLEHDGAFRAPVLISVSWKNITARQAFAALLDNYDLTMIENPEDSSVRITLKPQTGDDSRQR